jgi:1,2-diacylglycerol 3-alpha-glucosyltransferase
MFSNLYPPVVSGSSTQSGLLAREFARRGKQVSVITAKIDHESRDYEEVDGVHIYRLPCIRLPKMEIALNFPWLNYTFTPQNMRRITEIIKKRKPDILHLHNHMFDLAFSAILVRKKFHIPLVITIHTVIKHSQRLYNLILSPLDRILLKRTVINNADHIISPDDNIRKYVEDVFGVKNTTIVPYGIEIPKEPRKSRVSKLRQKFNLNNRRVILSVGHVHKIRDRKDLIEAMPMVLERMPSAVLLIVGAVATDIPAKTARKLGIEDSVIFTGPVPHDDIAAFLALGDLEAHWLNQDSPEKTSLGIASLESMGAGKVVVAVANENTYGHDVLRNGENVILVKPNNPHKLAHTIVSILGDPNRCRLIAQKARRTVEKNFSWENAIARTLAVYQLAARSGPPRR